MFQWTEARVGYGSEYQTTWSDSCGVRHAVTVYHSSGGWWCVINGDVATAWELDVTTASHAMQEAEYYLDDRC